MCQLYLYIKIYRFTRRKLWMHLFVCAAFLPWGSRLSGSQRPKCLFLTFKCNLCTKVGWHHKSVRPKGSVNQWFFNDRPPIWKQQLACPDWACRAFQSKSTGLLFQPPFSFYVFTHLTQMVLTFTNSNIPKAAHSLPKPEFFTPPKGKEGSDRTKSFTKHMPASMSSTAMRSPWWPFLESFKSKSPAPPSHPVGEKTRLFLFFLVRFFAQGIPQKKLETRETEQMRLPWFLQVNYTSILTIGSTDLFTIRIRGFPLGCLVGT